MKKLLFVLLIVSINLQAQIKSYDFNNITVIDKNYTDSISVGFNDFTADFNYATNTLSIYQFKEDKYFMAELDINNKRDTTINNKKFILYSGNDHTLKDYKLKVFYHLYKNEIDRLYLVSQEDKIWTIFAFDEPCNN